MPTNATIQIARMNRMVTRYSTPSGHAAAISTSDPKSTARPNTESRRPNQSGPWPESTSDRLVTSSVLVADVVTSSVGTVSPVAGSELGVVAAVAGSFSTVKVMLP